MENIIYAQEIRRIKLTNLKKAVMVIADKKLRYL